jgi:hypothetical protein
MKTYVNHDYIPVKGLLILVFGSISIGIIIGIASYFISTLIFLHFVFPVVIGFLSLIIFTKLTNIAKIRNPIITRLFGLLSGICIALSFYSTPFVIEKNTFVQDLYENYHYDKQSASIELDRILRVETGSAGLIGYMALRAREGESYTNYIVINAVPVNEFSYTIKSTWAWIYWIIETILFSIPLVLISPDKGYFNIKDNDWYSKEKQLGSVSILMKTELLRLFQMDDIDGICTLVIPEEQAVHPTLELYFAPSKYTLNNVLLIVKETTRVTPTKVSRKPIGEWEINQQELLLLNNTINQKICA